MKLGRSVDIALAVLFVGLLAGAWIFHDFAGKQIETSAQAHLQTMLMLRNSALKSYLESLRSEVILWSDRGTIKELIKFFQS